MKKKAFTLIEVILAIFILEVGLLGIAGFYAYSFQISKVAREDTIAANLAQGLLEEQSAKQNYEDIQDVPKAFYEGPFANFQKEVVVTCVKADLSPADSCAVANMKKIVVTIYWPVAGGEENFKTVTLRAREYIQ